MNVIYPENIYVTNCIVLFRFSDTFDALFIVLIAL